MNGYIRKNNKNKKAHRRGGCKKGHPPFCVSYMIDNLYLSLNIITDLQRMNWTVVYPLEE